VNKSVNDDRRQLSSFSAFSEAIARIASPTPIVHESGDPRPISVLEGLVEQMSKSRAQRVKALEEWAERVESSVLKEVDAEALRAIAELAERTRRSETRCTMWSHGGHISRIIT